jgi:hypothetical protein
LNIYFANFNKIMTRSITFNEENEKLAQFHVIKILPKRNERQFKKFIKKNKKAFRLEFYFKVKFYKI